MDEAILRPGRMEVHLEIGLPDEKGRQQIFEIHTRQQRKNGLLEADVDLDSMAARTKNYTGAEIEAVCKSAVSWALGEMLTAEDLNADKGKGKKISQKEKTKIKMMDFERALAEVKPAFGVDDKTLDNCIREGWYDFGAEFQKVHGVCTNFIKQMMNSSSFLHTILLEGSNGCGKTALAARLALDSGFSFVKMITPENFVGYNTQGKIQAIVKVFEDAYKSPLSLIVLDDIERLIEYIPVG